ncbi:MAG TPA: NAD(P)-dependent oxidoreductase [Dokdonella sp.]|nr:NAD(P)-dependent oxidoreductase [Dokdonella sp.]HQZ62879.1 NAD(P)-dependent oxidoreductase [Dokdonella sp.]
MRVTVTGANGFIGRHVVRELRKRGAQVIAVSRHPDQPLDSGVTPCAMDIKAIDRSTLDRIGKSDVLLHLAWGGLPNYRSAHHLESEMPKHAAFLESCILGGMNRVVVAGTCFEYGLQSGELDETAPVRPITAYGLAKHSLHRHLLHLRERHAFGLGWLRPFYLYGDGQAATSLYAQLRTAIDSGSHGFDMSHGDQVRDFLPVELAASRIAALALTHPDMGTVNLCSGKPTRVIDIVGDWLHEWNADIVLNRGVHPVPDYEPFAFWGNARRLNALLEST